MDNELLTTIMHEIVTREIEKYSKNMNLQSAYLEEKDIRRLISKILNTKYYKSINDILSQLLKKGLLIKYTFNGKLVYRSIYFDVLYDYINIKENPYGKPTVLDYKILSIENRPIIHNLPKYDIECNKLYGEILNILNEKYFSKNNITDEKFKLAVSLIKSLICLHEKYSKLQYDSTINILTEILQGGWKSYIISAPTGWGKTEAFMIPILIYTLIQKIFGVEGVKIILIYPRKALASNQIKRIIKYYIKILEKYRSSNIIDFLPLIAIRDGQSLSIDEYKPGNYFRVKYIKMRAKNNNIAKYEIRINDHTSIELTNGSNRIILPFTNIRFEQTDIIPDILVTNLDTFNRIISTPRFRRVWENPDALSAIIFDEAHVYKGVYFLHLKYILKRLQGFIEKLLENSTNNRHFPLIIFSSATLHRGFKNYIEKILKRKIVVIDHSSSIDHKKKKLVIPLIIAPQPNVAGQWIIQLIAFYNSLFAFSKAIETKAIEKDRSIPYKSIAFIDSLYYLRSIFDGVKTLMHIKRVKSILQKHMSNTNDPLDLDKWAFINDKLLSSLHNYDEKINLADYLVKVHYGNLDQDERENIEESFNDRTFPVTLLSTSTLELGIDIPDLWNIVQFRPPFESDSFIQRIGRAGRSDNTLRIALGILVLTNQPSDIAYLYDEQKQQELLKVSSIKIPINETVTAQHVFMAIFDYFNTIYILNKLNNEKYLKILSSIYYKTWNNVLRISDIAKELEKLIFNKYKELINYLSGIFDDYNEEEIRNMINNVLWDLKAIYAPDEIIDKLIKKGFLDKVSEKAKVIFKLVNKLEDLYGEVTEREGMAEFINEFYTLTGKLKDVSNNLRMITGLKEEKLVNSINRLPESRNKIYELTEQFKKIYYELEERRDNSGYNALLDKLSELISECDKLIEILSNCNELREYTNRVETLEIYEEYASNIINYLSLITRKGIYNSSILSIPIKRVEIIYPGNVEKSRSEEILLATKRLSGLRIYKPIIQSYREEEL